MPRVKKEAPNLDPTMTYVSWQSFAVEIDGYPVDVQKGMRLGGDHPTVAASWWYWLPDGAAPSELAAAYERCTPTLRYMSRRMNAPSRRLRCGMRMPWYAFGPSVVRWP